MKAAAIALAAIDTLSLASSASAETVHCGEVIIQDTRVDNDLRNCLNDGLIIGADRIRLDLNGHVVDGDARSTSPDESDDHGIDNSAGHDALTVVNGSVRQFNVGVVLVRDFDDASATANRLRRLRITENGAGITLYNSPSNVITANSLARNGSAIVLLESHFNRIMRNLLIANRSGMSFDNANANLFTRNRVSRNGHWGIALFSSLANRITRNRVSGADGVPGTSVPGTGILLHGQEEFISRNVVFQNDIGIHAEQFSFTEGYQIVGNTVTDSRDDGILVELANDRVLVRENRAHRNGDDGIDVEDPRTTLTGNVANRNGDLGIEAKSAVEGRFVIDGGGNRARGNGNPLQCVNVFCR